jgi:hypothetical protein
MLEHISGFVILMREVGAKDQSWHCLNYAETWLADKVLRSEPCVAPYRVHYRGNLKQVLATYNNRALTADSPLSEDDLIDRYYPQPLDYSDGFLRFRYCGASAYADQSIELPEPPEFTKTPGLKFGSFYQFAVLALTNCGIPPKTAADRTGWMLASTIGPDKVPADAIIGGKTGLQYLRRVKVGAVRIKPLVPDANDPRAGCHASCTRVRVFRRRDGQPSSLLPSIASPAGSEHLQIRECRHKVRLRSSAPGDSVGLLGQMGGLRFPHQQRCTRWRDREYPQPDAGKCGQA